MELTPYVTTVEDSLVAAAAAGDEGTRRTATALAAALEPATRLAIMDALSDLAMEVTDALGDRSVDLRLEPGQVSVVVSPAATVEDNPPMPGGLDDAQGELSRVTLRLPESLKLHAERVAAGRGRFPQHLARPCSPGEPPARPAPISAAARRADRASTARLGPGLTDTPKRERTQST